MAKVSSSRAGRVLIPIPQVCARTCRARTRPAKYFSCPSPAAKCAGICIHGCKRCPMRIPLIPLRDIVIFPAVTMPLYVGRARTLAAVAAAGGGPVLFVGQRSGAFEAPNAADLYAVGTIGVVL